MNQSEIDILIHRNLTGAATPEEKNALELWLTEGESHPEYYRQLRTLWAEAEPVDYDLAADTEAEWEKVRRRLIPEASETVAPVRKMRPRWLPYAAAALLIVGLFALWRLFLAGPPAPVLAQTYETAAGEQRTLSLADGTEVVLNAASWLGVVEGFNGAERRLHLRGEAFFAVASDSLRPFFVEADAATAQVLGTAFNFSAYPDAPNVRIDVTEGVVGFSVDGEAPLRLPAGEAAEWSPAQGVHAVPYHDQAAAWRDGRLVFAGVPLSQVLRTLERHYAVTITTRREIADRTYTATFDNEPLEAVLDVLTQTFDWTVEQQDGAIIIQ